MMLLPLGGVAAVLALAAVAYACTTVGGTAKITHVARPGAAAAACGTSTNPCVARSGDTLTVQASGGAYRFDGQGNVIQYYLYMLNYQAVDDGMACMADETGQSEPLLIGGPKEASGGNITATQGMVPAAAPTEATHSQLGRALVCFMGAGAPGGNTVNEATKTVLTRTARMWGTNPDQLRIVAI